MNDFVDNYELPVYQDKTRLVLMPKDQSWLYAYWDLAPDSIKSFEKKMGKSIKKTVITLRIYNTTLLCFNGQNSNFYFDIEVGSEADNWYINLGIDSMSCYGELGLKTINGKFFPLTKSNHINMPCSCDQLRTDRTLKQIADNAQKKPYVAVKDQNVKFCPSYVYKNHSTSTIGSSGLLLQNH